MSECKYCKSQQTNVLEDSELIEYKDSRLNVYVVYSECANCKREFLSKKQILNNEARIRDAKKTADGLLTSTEVLEARVKLGLTQEQASTVFGGGKNAFSKYERAEVSQSVAMDKLIRICLKYPQVFSHLLVKTGLEKPTNLLSYEDNVISYASYATDIKRKENTIVRRSKNYEQIAN